MYLRVFITGRNFNKINMTFKLFFWWSWHGTLHKTGRCAFYIWSHFESSCSYISFHLKIFIHLHHYGYVRCTLSRIDAF